MPGGASATLDTPEEPRADAPQGARIAEAAGFRYHHRARPRTVRHPPPRHVGLGFAGQRHGADAEAPHAGVGGVSAHQQQRPRALLLVGGDTAYACMRRLGIGAVALAGEAEPYVPWGRVADGPWAGTVVVTKAGGFGDPRTLRRICARLLRRV